MIQLSLWDEPKSEEEEQDILLMPTRWADGDTSKRALERLALDSLGMAVWGLRDGSGQVWLNYHLSKDGLRASRSGHYARVRYRIISTGIIKNTVWCSCEEEEVEKYPGQSQPEEADEG